MRENHPMSATFPNQSNQEIWPGRIQLRRSASPGGRLEPVLVRLLIGSSILAAAIPGAYTLGPRQVWKALRADLCPADIARRNNATLAVWTSTEAEERVAPLECRLRTQALLWSMW